MEQWINIKGFERYSISNKSRIIDLKRNRILLPYNKESYERIAITDGTKQKQFYVHRLVAINFIPNPENKPFINHIDGNKSNNKINNLEWCTQKENINHAHITGLIKHIKGEKARASKFSDKTLLKIIS